MAEEPLVSPEEMESVLATEDAPETRAAEDASGRYSLRRPVAIAADAEAAARARIEQLAASLATTLSEELEMPIEIQVSGFQQQQVRTAVGSITEPSWVLSFAGGDGAVWPACWIRSAA